MAVCRSRYTGNGHTNIHFLVTAGQIASLIS